jgi:geranylgeranyl pyrophosphate synthase
MSNLRRSIGADELRVGAQAVGLIEELAGPLDHLFSSQGKQLRSALVQESAKAGPDSSARAVREGATAVELLHLGTLAHDDVVDDGKLRRGGETARVAYGNRASAYAGGVLVAAAAELMARHGQEATEAFAEAVTKICEGEMVEVEDLFNADRAIERYLRAIAGKTAAGFALAGWVGSWLGGADEHIAAGTGRFGHELGMAFQILDDTHDLCCLPTETGKQRGKDLQQGVYTLPVLYAALVDPLLRRELGHPIEEGELESLVKRVVASGGVKEAEEACRSFAERAKAAINEVPDLAREPLLELLHTALEPLGELTMASELHHV